MLSENIDNYKPATITKDVIMQFGEILRQWISLSFYKLYQKLETKTL